MIYLASPYSNPDPTIQHQRFEAVCQASAILMQRGFFIFSPICYSHPIAQFGLPTDWAFWEKYDKKFLSMCDEMWVLMLDGWKTSKGVNSEITIARKLGKPVKYICPRELTIKNTPTAVGVFEEAMAI